MTRRITHKIKELLQIRGITQKELADMTGITESSISHYVKGDRVPRGANLFKIAKALNTTTDELLKGDEDLENKDELAYAKTVIARNASQMSIEEKLELVKLLMNARGN